MSEANKKPLHLGRCIEDLDKLHSVPDLNAKRPTLLVKTAQKLMSQAEAARVAGDEETAYVYYMKYLRVVGSLSRQKDYQMHKRYYNSMLGTNGPTNALERADQLKTSLINRYQCELNTGVSASTEPQPAGSETDTDVDVETDTDTESNMDGDLLAPEDVVIRCEDLFELLFICNDSKVLVLDARPRAEYSRSHITHAMVVSVPSELVAPGQSAAALRRAMPVESLPAWDQRAHCHLIVLMDQSAASDGVPPPPGHTLHLLKTILLKWDVSVHYAREPVVLRGGYRDWVLRYPHLTTNPCLSDDEDHDMLTTMLDDIEYPTWDDAPEPLAGPLAEPLVESSSGEPRVDRSSKAAAVSLYCARARAVAQRQQQLAAAALQLEKERLGAERDWESVRDSRAERPTPEQRDAAKLREHEILSTLLQLESKHHDMEQENAELRRKLKEYQRIDAARQMAESDAAARQLQEAARQDLAQRQAAVAAAAKQSALLHERSRRLERKRIRRLQQELDLDEDDDDDQQLTPEQQPAPPSYDRASKPSAADAAADAVVAARRQQERERNYEPVYDKETPIMPGLTGLRNLGNSCYLNTALQCLSHTPAFRQYYTANTLQRHIDRSSRSGGALSEELAALLGALWRQRFLYIAPKDMRRTVSAHICMFHGGGQHDCHELLTMLLDCLQSELVDGGIVKQLFFGALNSTVRCDTCQHASVSQETFSSLSLELGDGRCNLQECLLRHAAPEALRGWRCANCKQERAATKRLSIVSPPPILILHLKRFYMKPALPQPHPEKRQNLVTFPLRGLALDLRVCSSETAGVVYDLYAIANHYGHTGCGHYTATVLCRGPQRRWVMFDDHVVRAVPEHEVISSAAYVLFYERRD